MSLAGATLLLALLSSPPPAGAAPPVLPEAPRAPNRPGVPLPPQGAGGVTARLWVLVPDQPAAPGLAQVLWLLEVEGPPGLEIDGPRLEDALDGWRRTAEASSWSAGARARIEVTWRLVQTKPGVMPLPGVTLRVRGRPGATWEELSWHDVLQIPRDVPPPVTLPPPPPPLWPRALAAAGAAGAAGLAGLLGAWGWRRWRSARRRPLTPAARALQALSPPLLPGDEKPAERFAHVAAVLRELLEAELGVPATRQTTDELVTALGCARQPEIIPRLAREVLELCDAAKFAGAVPPNASAHDTVGKARELAAALGQSAENRESGKKRRSGEGR